MENQYIYGVARVRALESSLLTDADMNQLLECRDYDACMDFLRGREWGSGDINETEDDMLRIEKEKTDQVINELVEDREERRILTISNEFHNVKAAVKKVCTDDGSSSDALYFKGTDVAPEVLEKNIRDGSFELLPDNISKVARTATETFLKSGDGQMCDIIVDRAALEEIKKAGLKSKNDMVKKYADIFVTIADIKIAIRCAMTGKDSDFIKKALVSCSGVSVTDLTAAASVGMDPLCEYLESVGFGEAASKAKISKSIFECWCDNRIIEEIKSQKYVAFTIGPILAYALARESEMKTVKIILSGKKNGFDRDFIRERIRVTYA